MKGLMGRVVRSLIVGVCACLPGKAGAEDIPKLVARAKQAVIEVGTLDAQSNVLGTGTAFFIRSDGTAVTNAHVIQGAARIVGLTNTGAEYRFERVIAQSQDADLAILKFSATDVPYLTLVSSQDAVEGQRVLVIGNPKGLQGTVSDGLIAAFREDHKIIQLGDNFLQATVTSIMASHAWKERSAIVIVWDEDDYAGYAGCCYSPIGVNGAKLGGASAPFMVITSRGAHHFVDNTTPYNHYVLLATLEKL